MRRQSALNILRNRKSGKINVADGSWFLAHRDSNWNCYLVAATLNPFPEGEKDSKVLSILSAIRDIQACTITVIR